jgi:acyl carrier protein
MGTAGWRLPAARGIHEAGCQRAVEKGIGMQSDEIKSRLTEIFRDVFNNPGLVITEGMTAKDVVTWDSLSNINMVVAVEKSFKIKFRIKDTRSLNNVGDLIELIKNKMG